MNPMTPLSKPATALDGRQQNLCPAGLKNDPQ